MNYYLYDCFDRIVGNPRGYATFRGAAQAERLRRGYLREQYDRMKDINPTNNLISRISQSKTAYAE